MPKRKKDNRKDREKPLDKAKKIDLLSSLVRLAAVLIDLING